MSVRNVGHAPVTIRDVIALLGQIVDDARRHGIADPTSIPVCWLDETNGIEHRTPAADLSTCPGEGTWCRVWLS